MTAVAILAVFAFGCLVEWLDRRTEGRILAPLVALLPEPDLSGRLDEPADGFPGDWGCDEYAEKAARAER